MTTLRLTYEELAERTGRTPEGARMLARRQQRQGFWRIDRGNDGRALVVVEEEDLVGQLTGRPPGQATTRPPGHVHGDRPPDHPFTQADGELVAELRGRIRALEAEREALIEAGDRLVDQVGEARERAARLEGELTSLREAHQREVGVLREALGDLAGRLDRAEALLARPWWRRLLG